MVQINRVVQKKKQNSSQKQDSSRKQTSSSKTNVFNVKVIDPNALIEKLRFILGKSIKTKTDGMLARMILDEFLGTKNITQKEYSTLCKKCDFEKSLCW